MLVESEDFLGQEKLLTKASLPSSLAVSWHRLTPVRKKPWIEKFYLNNL
jgi:hypothetical protein